MFSAQHIWLAAVLLGMASAMIPSYINICKRKDPDLNNCVVNSINQLREKLITGIEELQVPPLEPLRLPEIRLKTLNSRSSKFDANLTNIEIFGASTFRIYQPKIDSEKLKFDFRVSLPKLDFRGKYKIDATFLVLKLEGEGNFNGSFHYFNYTNSLRGQKIVRNNETYVHFKKLQLTITDISKFNIYFDNLFNGNPALDAAYNDILNENSELLLEDLKIPLETQLENVLTEIANRIVSTFTYDELFPDD